MQWRITHGLSRYITVSWPINLLISHLDPENPKNIYRKHNTQSEVLCSSWLLLHQLWDLLLLLGCSSRLSWPWCWSAGGSVSQWQESWLSWSLEHGHLLHWSLPDQVSDDHDTDHDIFIIRLVGPTAECHWDYTPGWGHRKECGRSDEVLVGRCGSGMNQSRLNKTLIIQNYVISISDCPGGTDHGNLCCELDFM